MSELVFRRINGRIVPIKVKKKDVVGASEIAGATVVSGASGVYAANQIRKANFFFGRSASLRGASLLASKGSATRASLITQSAVTKIAAKKFARRGFGALLAGTTIAAGLASIGSEKILRKKVSDEKKIAIAGTVGSIASGVGFAYFGSRVKLGQVAKLIKVANPKKTVSEAFSIYSTQGMKKSLNTIRKYKSGMFSESKTLAKQNKMAAQSVYNAQALNKLVKKKKSYSKKIDPNQGTLF